MKISAKRPNIIQGISIGLTLLLAFAVGWTALPLGVSGEWVWQRREFSVYEIIVPFLFELPVFLIAFGAAWFIAKKKVTPWAALLIPLAGLHFMPSVWDAGASGRGENIAAFLDLHTGGYLNRAVQISESGTPFASYGNMLKEAAKPPSHLDVHPPGNVYFSYLVLQFCYKVPASVDVAGWFLSSQDRAGLNELKQHGVFIDLPDDSRIFDAATLLLALANIGVFAGNVMIVLAAMALRKFVKSGAWAYGALFTAYIPGGVALFTGHYDVFMYFFGALTALTLALTLSAGTARLRLVFAGLTGLVLALATSCTLAFGALILLTALALAWLPVPARERGAALAVFGGSGLLFVALLWLCSGVNLIECCFYAWRNNSEFFQATGRSFRNWWPYSILDLLLFGGPLLVLLLFSRFRKPCFRRAMAPRWMFIWLVAPMLLVLLFSPFSSGEIGRLILFFLPLCSVAALLNLTSPGWRSCSKMLLGAALLSNIFLVYVIRIVLKLVTFY